MPLSGVGGDTQTVKGCHYHRSMRFTVVHNQKLCFRLSKAPAIFEGQKRGVVAERTLGVVTAG